MFVERKENSNYFYLFYKFDDIIDKKKAIAKFTEFCQNPHIKFEHIRIDDNKSYHDGTKSSIEYDISDVNECFSPDIETVSLSAEYQNQPFALSMNLNTFLLRLSTPKEYSVDYKKLEQLLSLT